MFNLWSIFDTPLKAVLGGTTLVGGAASGVGLGFATGSNNTSQVPPGWNNWSILGGWDNSNELSKVKIEENVDSWFIVFKPNMCQGVDGLTEKIDVLEKGSGFSVTGRKFAGGNLVCFKLPG